MSAAGVTLDVGNLTVVAHDDKINTSAEIISVLIVFICLVV